MSLSKALLALSMVLATAACGGSGGGGGGDGTPVKLADPQASKKVTTSFAALQKLEERKTGRPAFFAQWMSAKKMFRLCLKN